MYLSVIIPSYNEEERIASTLQKIESFLEGKGFDYEILVVDDGSSDKTKKIALESNLAQKGRLGVLANEKNMGKGYSVKRGVREAIGEYILFTDADLSTPIDEIEKLLHGIECGADIAVGSRSINTSNVVMRQPLYRQTMGKVFNLLVRMFLGENFKDTQCGFKLFKQDAAKSLFGNLTTDGFAFDAELLFLARKRGYKVREIGVKWKNSPSSTVHPVSSSLRMLWDIFKIRRIHR
ncbi:MAG: dolichyl-phosphate beta-glucosyltransferase [Candidatus Omnitrophota bacterium]